jgi:hypothetical protein
MVLLSFLGALPSFAGFELISNDDIYITSFILSKDGKLYGDEAVISRFVENKGLPENSIRIVSSKSIKFHGIEIAIIDGDLE